MRVAEAPDGPGVSMPNQRVLSREGVARSDFAPEQRWMAGSRVGVGGDHSGGLRRTEEGSRAKRTARGPFWRWSCWSVLSPQCGGAQGREESGAPPASGWAAGWVQRREVGKRARWAWVVQLMLPPPQDDHRTLALLGVTPSPGDRPRVLASLDRTTKSWSI